MLISNSKPDGRKIFRKVGGSFLYLATQQYPDGEQKLFTNGRPKVADIIYFKFDKRKSFDEQLFNLFCLLDKFADKKKTDLILPYLPYMRSCPVGEDEIDKLSFIISQFNKHARKVYLLYPHNLEKVKKYLNFKNIVLLDIEDSIIRYLKSLGEDPVLVSPDDGFSKKIMNLAKRGGLEYVVLCKKRISPTRVEIQPLNEQNLKKILQNKDRLFIVADDIVSTGNTLVKAGLYLRKQGVKKVRYFAIHNTSKAPTKINVYSSNSLDGDSAGLDFLENF
ncbi:MAG: phosphoribosyltransferase family protein [Candidatus Staskawiczbacteria bacterium]